MLEDISLNNLCFLRINLKEECLYTRVCKLNEGYDYQENNFIVNNIVGQKYPQTNYMRCFTTILEETDGKRQSELDYKTQKLTKPKLDQLKMAVW